MISAKFSIDEIDVGDSIMFDDNEQENYGSYWTVLSKTQNQLTVVLHSNLISYNYTIYITEVTHLEKKELAKK